MSIQKRRLKKTFLQHNCDLFTKHRQIKISFQKLVTLKDILEAEILKSLKFLWSGKSPGSKSRILYILLDQH